MPGEAMSSGAMAIGRRNSLLEVERLTKNPEKLANAGGRCWNLEGHLRAKRSFRTHRPPYPTMRGLITAFQETNKLLHDESGWTVYIREDLKEKTIENYHYW